MKHWCISVTILFALQLAISVEPTVLPKLPKFCTPNEEYFEECNKCWCVGEGIPLCTVMPCAEIPKEKWGNGTAAAPRA